MSPGDLMPFGAKFALLHPVRVVLFIAIATAILAFPARAWTLETFGWSIVPLGLWTVAALYLLSWRPVLLIRRWRLIVPLLLLAVAAAGVLGMMNTDQFSSKTGESLGGKIGVAIAISPGQWDRFFVSTTDYAVASLRIAVLVIAAAVIFTPRRSWRATAMSSRYSWKAAVVTTQAAAESQRKLKDGMERRRTERRDRKVQEEFAIAAAIAEAELEKLNGEGADIEFEPEPISPRIHGIAAEGEFDEDELLNQPAPWDDSGEEEDFSTNPMDQELVLRALPGVGGGAAAAAMPEIISTAVLSTAASQYKWPMPRLDILHRLVA